MFMSPTLAGELAKLRQADFVRRAEATRLGRRARRLPARALRHTATDPGHP